MLNHRNWPAVGATVESLRSQTHPPDEIVVVDNSEGSEGSVPADGVPGTLLVVADHNGGYAHGMNLGISRTSCDLVLLVTHDVVMSPTALEHLARRLNASPAGAVGPVIGFRDDPERTYSAGGAQEGWDLVHVGRDSPLATWVGKSPARRAWLDGACILVRRELLQTAGQMDEGYFMYFEEIDHQLLAAAKGWTFEVVPDAVAWQRSGRRGAALPYRNRLRLIARHGTRTELLRELGSQARLVVDLARRRRMTAARTVASGLTGWLVRRDPRRLL